MAPLSGGLGADAHSHASLAARNSLHRFRRNSHDEGLCAMQTMNSALPHLRDNATARICPRRTDSDARRHGALLGQPWFLDRLRRLLKILLADEEELP